MVWIKCCKDNRKMLIDREENGNEIFVCPVCEYKIQLMGTLGELINKETPNKEVPKGLDKGWSFTS